MLFYQTLAFAIHVEIEKKSYKNNKFKISAPTWNEEFELLDGSYSVSNIQDYFKYIFKKHGTITGNPSTMIYVNKIENRIMFKIKTGYYLESLNPERMKLMSYLVQPRDRIFVKSYGFLSLLKILVKI